MLFDPWWVSWLLQVAQLWQCGAWPVIDAAPWLCLSDLLNPSIVRLISPNTGATRVLRSSPLQSHTDWPRSSPEPRDPNVHQTHHEESELTHYVCPPARDYVKNERTNSNIFQMPVLTPLCSFTSCLMFGHVAEA